MWTAEVVADEHDGGLLAALESGELIQLLRYYQFIFTDQEFFEQAENLKTIVRQLADDATREHKEELVQAVVKTITMVQVRHRDRVQSTMH